MNPADKPPPPDFEAALTELRELVALMEQGDLSLDQSLAHFERGVSLSRQCEQALTAAEQRIQLLMRQQDGSFQPLNLHENDD